MEQKTKTVISSMRVREKPQVKEMTKTSAAPEWYENESRPWGGRFLKNLSVSAALVLCAVVLRTGEIPQLNPSADVILTAATDHSLLDEQLGKLSFVSSVFPEAVLVFGTADSELSMPVSSGMVVHAWSESEPYMSWQSSEEIMSSCADGEVMGVYHGNDGERLVQVMGYDGLSCMYGNLAEVSVQTGDAVTTGDVLGMIMSGKELVLEVRKNGQSVNPGLLLPR